MKKTSKGRKETPAKKPRSRFKPIPDFRNEDEEREFWATHCSTDYIDWSKAEETIFPNLKRTDPAKLNR